MFLIIFDKLVELPNRAIEQKPPTFCQLGSSERINTTMNDASEVDRLKPTTNIEPNPSRRQSGASHKPIETSMMEKSRDEKGNKNINHYVVLQELGRGGFGKVSLVYCSLTQ